MHTHLAPALLLRNHLYIQTTMPIKLFSHAGADRPLLAIALLLIATFTLALQDSLMKFMSADTTFWQIQTLRSLSNVVITLLLAVMPAVASGGLLLLKPRNVKGVYLRAFFLLITMFFFFSGAPFLSVTEMAAGLYTYPVFVCLLAGPVLGEVVGRWRIASIVLGSIGALIVISPWQDEFSSVQLLPVTAGFFFACNILTLRSACRQESTLALAFAAGLLFLVAGLTGIAVLSVFPLPISIQTSMPYVAIGWPQLTWLIVCFAVLASALNLAGNICMTRAYQTADVSLLAPIDFSYLIFAALWGRIIFSEWPTTNTIIGMLLIIGAGVTIAWREHKSVRT